jgi:thiosulfate dehydrogenase
MNDPASNRGMGMVMAVCAVIGAVTVAATPEYGRRLMMARGCGRCHLDAGAEPGELSLIGATRDYARDDALMKRVDECLTRNLHLRPLALNGVERAAVRAWLEFLAAKDAATSPSLRKDHDPPAFATPERAANPQAGEQLFGQRCADCHGKDGAGLLASRDPAKGYLFPPLWGRDSFPDASDMRRISTLARFVKAKMPLGRPDLTDDQAFDVAAFIESKPRASMSLQSSPSLPGVN